MYRFCPKINFGYLLSSRWSGISCIAGKHSAGPVRVSTCAYSFQNRTLLHASKRMYASEATAIPDAPLPPVIDPVLNALGEPTFASIGLNSYWPPGWFQWFIESLHVSLNLPWWAAIAMSTVVIRLCLFPFIIDQKRMIARYTNAMPQLTSLQERLTQARLSGNYVEVVQISKEMREFVTKNNINPLGTFKILFIQVPLFLCAFAGLRDMANLPVTSLQTGGLSWFTDLTVPDPYYILPLLSMTSILIMFEVGTEMPTNMAAPMMRNIIRAFPIIGFIMVMNMPSALLWYWTISNFISLTQFGLLRLPAVRNYFRLVNVVPPPKSLGKKRGFLSGFSESMTNTRLLAELENRERLDFKAWRDAGTKAPQITFRHNPKKLVTEVNSESSKKSNHG